MQEKSKNILNNHNILERLKTVRSKTLGLTQAEIGKSLDMTQAAWNRIEKGKNNLTVDNLKLLGSQHGIKPEWVLTGKGEMIDSYKLEPDKQHKRLIIIRNQTKTFRGTPRIAAEALDVDLEKYQNWEMGLEPIPEDIMKAIYERVKDYVRKEWWFEGKGEMFKHQDESAIKIEEPSEFYLTQAVEPVPNEIKKDIDDCINEMVCRNDKKERAVFGEVLKIKLREVGLLPGK